MRISLIAAMAENRVIGQDNKLPWHLPADLKHFKELTMGKPMIMGRKTWESLPGVLPGRKHIVLTTDRSYRAEDCTLVYTLDEALAAAGDAPEVMVVGGATIYALFLSHAERLYLTLVHARIEGETHFPLFDQDAWRETDREWHAADERNRFDYSFINLERA